MVDNEPYIKHYVLSPVDLQADVAERARARRLALGLTQVDLALAAGVSRATIARFERGADIGFQALIRIAFALRAEREFTKLFPEYDARTFDDIVHERSKRRRVRKKRSC